MNRRNRLRRAALVLALVVLAAIVTGVAASAAKTAIPEKLTGKWEQDNFGPVRVMVVGPRGKVYMKVDNDRYYMTFSHANVTANRHHGRLTISGPRSCSGTGRYRWTITLGGYPRGYHLRLTKIHDACKARVNLFPYDWNAGQRPLN